MDGGVEALGIEPVYLGHELPRVFDRIPLEIVAEGEVAEHLEEGVMTGRPPDLLEVVVLAPCPHTLLRRRRPLEAEIFLAQEDALELDHPGVREEERGIVGGYQRGAGPDLVPSLPEEVQESCTDFSGLHRIRRRRRDVALERIIQQSKKATRSVPDKPR